MDLIFSDIHADIGALEKILHIVNSKEFKKNYGEFSRIINLGDVLERGTNPKKVLGKFTELSKNYTFESIMGNHDEAFLYNRKVSGSSFESLDAHNTLTLDDLEFFKKNKDETFGRQDFVDKKNNLMCVHGGPLDPKKITPSDAEHESWLYQRTWQRLSQEDFEFFSYAGYHYKADSAFSEVGNYIKNFVILCGHQHMEAAIEQDEDSISNIYSKTQSKLDKIEKHILESREFQIKDGKNYLIRLGLGGPEGYYGTGMAIPHFGIFQHDQKKITLFSIHDG